MLKQYKISYAKIAQIIIMEEKKIYAAIPWLLAIGSMFVIVGALFKLMYWPGANVLLLLGLVMEAIGIPLLIFYLWHNRAK